MNESIVDIGYPEDLRSGAGSEDPGSDPPGSGFPDFRNFRNFRISEGVGPDPEIARRGGPGRVPEIEDFGSNPDPRFWILSDKIQSTMTIISSMDRLRRRDR